MLQAEAERSAKQMMMSGCRHHTYEDERRAYNKLFHMEREEFIDMLNSPGANHTLLSYTEVLGPTRLRAVKNSLICVIVPVCRMAIDLGADVELSFSLSDYYINLLESLQDEVALLALSKQILIHYFDLVQNKQRQQYSKQIASAVRYIGRNLYEPCRVSDIAAYVGLEPHYFAALFSQQTGVSPGKYIRRCKLDEAKRLLSRLGMSVTKVAEVLGFSDTAHFSRCFKDAYGVPPSHILKRDALWEELSP